MKRVQTTDDRVRNRCECRNSRDWEEAVLWYGDFCKMEVAMVVVVTVKWVDG